MVRLRKAHPPGKPQTTAVLACEFQRRRRDVGALDAGKRQVVRTGERDTAAAGAKIEHTPHPGRVDPRRELPLDQLGER